jgi:hypothetical protein
MLLESCLKHSLISHVLTQGTRDLLPWYNSRWDRWAPSWTHAALPLVLETFPCPTSQKAPHRTPQDLDPVSASFLHRAQKTPSTAGFRYYSGFGGVARNLGGHCATMLAVKALSARTASIRSCVLINNKCISLPCSRIVVPTLLLQRHVVQDLFAAHLGQVSTCHHQSDQTPPDLVYAAYTDM